MMTCHALLSVLCASGSRGTLIGEVTMGARVGVYRLRMASVTIYRTT